MKKIFFISLFILQLFVQGATAQAVIADPAVNFMRVTSTNYVPMNELLIPIDSVIEIRVPIINYNLINALPSGSCKIKIGLGSRLVLPPGFDLGTVPTSNYFAWTAENNGGQVQLTGDLIAALPSNFADTAIFLVKGSMLGSSTVTTNFLVTNHNTSINLSDQNGNNNYTSLPYTIVERTGGPLPVDFTSLDIVRTACKVQVHFTTENEINVQQFEIESSRDGVTYQRAGILPATNAGTYRFIFMPDNNNASRYLFIRIKSVDLDGRFEYSSVKRVSGECDENEKILIVFPNPAPVHSSFFNIRNQAGTFNGRYIVRISDMSGKLVSQKTFDLVGVNQFRFDHQMLAAGQYLIQLSHQQQGEIATVRWQKK
ncbi:MAG: T9SS type A sorting domain-containing protein [Ferruginibacter sp.]